MSVTRSRGYRMVRMHRIQQQAVRATRCSSPTKGNLRSVCLVFGKDANDGLTEEQPYSNNVRLYDSNTFMEASFDRVLREPTSERLWRQIGPLIDVRRHNNLVVMLQRQPRNLLTNYPLLEQYKLDNQQFHSKSSQWGVIEKAADQLTKQLDKHENEELLISVLGFCHGSMVDLLNLSREQAKQEKLKIVKEGGFITVNNLTQMEVQSPEFLVNTLLYARHFGSLFEKMSGQLVEAELCQLTVCKLSVDGMSIQSVRGKCSFLRISSEAHALKASLENCLRCFGREDSFIPTRSSKLTHCLEDSLNLRTSITLLTEVDTSELIRNQMDSLAFHNSLQGRTLMRKNYYGDEEIVRKITDLSNSGEDTVNRTTDLEDLKVRSQKLPSLQGKINPALLSDTVSSCQRRASLMEERSRMQQKQNPSIVHLRSLSTNEKQQVIRQLYKFV